MTPPTGPLSPGDALALLPGPVLGLDVGNRRLGVALLDPSGPRIHPLDVIERGRGRDDWAELHRIARTHDTRGFIVGLPLLPSGDEGEQAQAVRGYLKALRSRYPQAWIALADERHTTADAALDLRELDLSPAARRRRLDAQAAANILEAYLQLGPLDIIR